MTTALGVAPDANGVGLDPLTHRLLIKQHWNNTGVVMGLTVSGRGDLRYQVSAGAAICSMSAADGYTEAYWNGGVTENAVDAGDSTYSRIDVVYMLSNTVASDNTVHVMVAQGTPSASPVIPSLPAGAQPLAYRLMPANASTTGSSTPTGDVDFATSRSGIIGRLCHETESADGPANFNGKPDDYYSLNCSTWLPTDRIVECRFSGIACAADHANPSKPTANATQMACWYAGIQLDGVDIPGGGAQFQVSRAWQPFELNVILTVKAGWHQFRLRNHRVPWGENVYFICRSDGSQTFPPRTLEVWDRGVAK